MTGQRFTQSFFVGGFDMLKRIVFLLLGIVLVLNAGAAFSQTINKPSIQITLRTYQHYYRNGQEDQETWSWTPRIVYRVVGPISAGRQVSVEFALPSGQPWIKMDCHTNETKEGHWREPGVRMKTAE